MFPRRLIGLASLPFALGLATDALAQRRPEPPPQFVQQAPVPERYQVAEQEVLARLREPPPPPVQTVVIRHEEPVDAYYASRRRCDPPPLPRPAPVVIASCPPPVVVVDPCPPPVVYCPPPRPVYCPPVRAYDCRPSYRSYYRGGDCDSGWSFSVRIGDGYSRSSFRYNDRDCDRRYDRGGRGHHGSGHHGGGRRH